MIGVCGAWRSALRRINSVGGRGNCAHKGDGSSSLIPELLLTPKSCDGHLPASSRVNIETTRQRFGESLHGSRRREGQFLGLCSSGVLPFCREDCLHREKRLWLGYSTYAAGGIDASDFLFLCFAGLALLGTSVSYAEDDNAGLQEQHHDDDAGLQEQPQAKSNIHTAKWRIYTDKARELCSQGSFEKAENYFYRALDEAKLGFGEEDPHVASCFNNLAELFRMKKEYDKAEPLYLEAVKRLRESSGTEDGSVGFALHNLGGFYLSQRKLEQAQRCYEEALKIKGRALGLDHPEYANTMFHLGEVIRIQGDLLDSLALIRDSIRILDQVGLGNTNHAVKRLMRFSELLVYAGELNEAEAVQRKILQVVDFSRDFNFNDMVAALGNLSVTLQKQGKLAESATLLEKSIELLNNNKGSDDIQIAVALSKLGKVYFQQGRHATSQQDNVQALELYGKADDLFCRAVKIAESTQVNARQRKSVGGDTADHALLLADWLATLGSVRICKLDLLTDREQLLKAYRDAETVLRPAVTLLEEMIVQHGEQSASNVWKLYKRCLRYLDDLSRRNV